MLGTMNVAVSTPARPLLVPATFSFLCFFGPFFLSRIDDSGRIYEDINTLQQWSAIAHKVRSRPRFSPMLASG